jgi:signal transduction histidine kinase
VDGLGVVDEGSLALLARFAGTLSAEGPPRDRAALLASYARAELSAGEYPVALAHWEGDRVVAEVVLGADPRTGAVAPVVIGALAAGEPLLLALPADPVASLVLAVPFPTGEVTTVVVRARTRIAVPTLAAPLLDGRNAAMAPPYELTLRPEAAALDVARTPWERRGDHLHAEWSLPTGDGAAVRVHAKVGFDAIDALLPRGGLVVLLDLAVLALLWALDVAGDGALARWRRRARGRWRRSYRAQLTIALFAFFVVPAGAFAVWSSRRLQTDDRATRELLVREYLRRAALVTGPAGPTVVGVPPDVPQFLYRSGRLVAASDPLHITLAPTGRWLDPAVERALGDGEDVIATRALVVGDRTVLFGFKPLGREAVVAVPALVGDAALDQRRRDLGVLVLLTTLLGAVAALALSGVAARRLARPIGTLRDAALAVAGGARTGLALPDDTVEFAPVFRAFDAMARDLGEREAQLARVQRVFAWSEMARQVAHEIKNPLTPMRLGVQHVLRAWRDQRPDFGSILETNVTRVLDAIDHLDATARGFARFGAPPEARRDVGPCDLSAVLRDLTALLQLGGGGGLACAVEGAGRAVPVAARPEELREVLLNLAENARAAGARHLTFAVAALPEDGVQLTVTDDGSGIEPEVLPRVFEPHFSTRSSGSGLGLAISRRLVEEWGGAIDLRSAPGVGTVVTLRLRAAATPAVAPP